MESFSKFVSIIILAIGLFLIPLMYISEQEEEVTQTYVSERVVAFVENVKKQGKITQKTYNDLMSDLGNTNNVYDVEIVHKRVETVPNVAADGSVSSTQDFYVCYYTDEIKQALFTKIPTAEEQLAGVVEGEYHLNKGDYITVSVANRGMTSASRIKAMVFGDFAKGATVLVTYGGTVQDENY